MLKNVEDMDIWILVLWKTDFQESIKNSYSTKPKKPQKWDT